MIRGLAYRIGLTIINILFPPVAVLMVCGPNFDFILNCTLLLLAVIPSHIHGFYITWTYFSRKRKVCKTRDDATSSKLLTKILGQARSIPRRRQVSHPFEERYQRWCKRR